MFMCLKESEDYITVFEIQRMSTEDGPGIRTTVFVKGCNLTCIWCQNPESISLKPQLIWIGVKCIGCKTCVKSCQNKAIILTEKGILIDREKCNICGICTEECPSTAMELLGKKWKVEELIKEVEKDRAFFENSGGGITVSGGEPTVQGKPVAAFLKGLKDVGIHTALDTSGMCSKDTLNILLPHTDLVLYDLKEINPHKHKDFTKQSNEIIFQNILYIHNYIRAHKIPSELWIRTPVIPDATANEENIKGLGKFIAENLNDVLNRWELCSFNNLCKDKYERMEIDWFFKNYSLLSKDFMEGLTEVAKNSGVNPDIVLWTGATKE